jgi:hypothetical protein
MTAGSTFILDPLAADYAYYALKANAFATEVDAQWTATGAPTPTCAELDLIEECSAGVWSFGRSPLATGPDIIPTNYSGVALAVVNAAQQGNVEIIAAGVDPNAACGGGGGGGGNMSMVRFPIGTATVSSTNSIPASAVISSVMIEIDTPYSEGATIEVGQTGTPTLLMATSDNDPQADNQYFINTDTPWGTLDPVLVTIGGSPSAGAGYCKVEFAVPED